eukprot:CAMPEP_0114515270 /NCGR_PEP_ID=MMETSP0109-20121206/16640_1 /TAXON_ID=29199 /ORGANISM="Chlorarachnion reptans, Strain CCCM449" /LENGTH=172 /DNA_ID=CAMNT_0001695451 /DNA_START=145 /DNA_END=663 /DNA_ORIENTATION=-
MMSQFCSNCCTIFVPGETCRVRLISKKRAHSMAKSVSTNSKQQQSLRYRCLVCEKSINLKGPSLADHKRRKENALKDSVKKEKERLSKRKRLEASRLKETAPSAASIFSSESLTGARGPRALGKRKRDRGKNALSLKERVEATLNRGKKEGKSDRNPGNGNYLHDLLNMFNS